jgi:predicted NBD/HSP70 family sugar kinase
MTAGYKILHKKQRLRAAIFGAGTISRKELQKKTGLNYRSVIAYAEELKHQGLIAENTQENPRGGRSSIHYRSCSDCIYCIAVQLYRNNVTLTAADINSNIFHAAELVIPPEAGITDMLRQILGALDTLKKSFPDCTLAGIELCRFPYGRSGDYYEGIRELHMTLRQQYRFPVGLHTSYDLILFQMARNFDLKERLVLLAPGDDIYLSMVENREINGDMEQYLHRFRHYQLSMKSQEKCYCGKQRCVKNLLTQAAQLSRYNHYAGIDRPYASLSEGLHYLCTQALKNERAAVRILEECGELTAEAMYFLKKDLQADHVLLYFKDAVVNRKMHEAYERISGEKLPEFSAFGVTRSDVQSASVRIALSRIIP